MIVDELRAPTTGDGDTVPFGHGSDELDHVGNVVIEGEVIDRHLADPRRRQRLPVPAPQGGSGLQQFLR